MTTNGILLIAVYFGLILLLTKPIGAFMARVFEGRRTFLHPTVASSAMNRSAILPVWNWIARPGLSIPPPFPAMTTGRLVWVWAFPWICLPVLSDYRQWIKYQRAFRHLLKYALYIQLQFDPLVNPSH